MSLGSLLSASSRVLIPEIGTRVTIAGEPGVYLVSAVDRHRYTVNVIPANGGPPQFGIHISAVSLLQRYPVISLLRSDHKLIEEILEEKQR